MAGNMDRAVSCGAVAAMLESVPWCSTLRHLGCGACYQGLGAAAGGGGVGVWTNEGCGCSDTIALIWR